jgi:hypothetical protein
VSRAVDRQIVLLAGYAAAKSTAIEIVLFGASGVSRSWFERFVPARTRYRRVLAAHHAGELKGHYETMPVASPGALRAGPQRMHFWTPHAWPSTAIHVDRVLGPLRTHVEVLGLTWQISSGPELPPHPVDCLLCLKTVPPARAVRSKRMVLLLNDDADRLWGQLGRFDDVVVVSSPVLASLVGCVHPRVWFVEETEPLDTIAKGATALLRPPSLRGPGLLWHGTKESLDGLVPLREALDAFAAETNAFLTIVTNRPETTERWGALQVRYVPWSPEALASAAAEARLGIVPARPTLADSYLKSAGRLRCLLALGCPAIGDGRSPDVNAFGAACNLPTAHTEAEWLAALRQLWSDPARLDAAAGQGHALVRARYGADRTARQWLWFFGTELERTPAPERDASAAGIPTAAASK